jgi:hypothetical protein
MLKAIRRFFHKLLDRVVWVVVYPDKKKSIKFTWSVAKDYKEMFGGEIKHCEDLKAE